jgi:starch synthase
VLRTRASNVAGILNGVDYEEWNPESDKLIAANYSAKDLSGKGKCKQDLLREFGLDPTSALPVIGIVSRFAAQKGFDLIQQIADRLSREDVTVVVLGTGDKDY